MNDLYSLHFRIADNCAVPELPGFVERPDPSDVIPLADCFIPGRGLLMAGKNGIDFLGINKSEDAIFIVRGEHTEAVLNSRSRLYPGFPLYPAEVRKPVKGVLLDLDGTCVKSEALWIAVIEDVTNLMREKNGLGPVEFAGKDLPHVSGRTVPDHLTYCRDNYFPGGRVSEAQQIYTEVAEREMRLFSEGRGREDAFDPVPGLKNILTGFKEQGIKIGLVTSGLYYKAYPEIEQAFVKLDMGRPEDFFDAFITAGTLTAKGRSGTMGNGISKPWPNIYFEAAQAMGFSLKDREHFAGIGDSASDVLAVRTMGLPFLGIDDGNIAAGGLKSLCTGFFQTLQAAADNLLQS
jgi:beta-phosphoglucomutase-like phosphatase (HAD superfamily)